MKLRSHSVFIVPPLRRETCCIGKEQWRVKNINFLNGEIYIHCFIKSPKILGRQTWVLKVQISRAVILPTVQQCLETRSSCRSEALNVTSRNQEGVWVFLSGSGLCKVLCLLVTLFIGTTTTSEKCRSLYTTSIWVLGSQNFASSLMRKRRREVSFLVTIERPVHQVK